MSSGDAVEGLLRSIRRLSGPVMSYTDGTLIILGGDYFARRHHPDRHRDRLIEQLHGLGYRVTLNRVA